ncbi:MAG: hypothetical protein ACI81V_000211 [Lentimonas sp.]|jgi:hypothetical protein
MSRRALRAIGFPTRAIGVKAGHPRLFACGLLALVALLQADATSSLIERSPFLAPDEGKPAPKLAVQPKASTPFPEVDFVGFSGGPENWEIALNFPRINQVHWLKHGEQAESVRLMHFNAAEQSVTLSYLGQTDTFKLNQVAPQLFTPPPYQPSQPQQPLPQILGEQSEASASQRAIPRRRVILPKRKQ